MCATTEDFNYLSNFPFYTEVDFKSMQNKWEIMAGKLNWWLKNSTMNPFFLSQAHTVWKLKDEITHICATKCTQSTPSFRWLRLFLVTTVINPVYARIITIRRTIQEPNRKHDNSGKGMRNSSLFSAFNTFSVAGGRWMLSVFATTVIGVSSFLK